MAVDTLLNTATPLQTKPPAPIKQADAIHLQAKDKSRLTTMVASIKNTGPADGDGQVDCEKGDHPPSQLSKGKKSDQKSNTPKSESVNTKFDSDKGDAISKVETLKESCSKSGQLQKSNKTNVRSGVIVKNKEAVKNSKGVKENDADSVDNKAKENNGERINKNNKSLSRKWNTSQDDEMCSDESSTEYITFDAYVDMISHGIPPDRKCCSHQPDSRTSPLSAKPSSPSSSISSISTININPPQSPFLQNSTFDAKSLRNSLLETSELPPTNDILLQSLFREKERASGHVCAWNPIDASHQLDFKTNVTKLTSKRSQNHQPQQQSVSNPSRPQRSLTVTQTSQRDENNINNSFAVPAVYDRLASLGRYREFCFQHRPDDWGWYMKEYNAVHTVGKVGVKKKKKQLKFGVDVPDPYATMGKRVNTHALDSRQNTIHQGDIAALPKERQPKKTKSGEEEADVNDPAKNGETVTGRDRDYPVLAPTREANAVFRNARKSSKPDRAVAKSTAPDPREKRPQPLNKSNNSNNNNNNSSSNRSQPSQTPRHPHHQHPGFPQLSGEDVKLNLISSKILQQKDKNEEDDYSDDSLHDDEAGEKDKLWQNPFQSPTRRAKVKNSCLQGETTKLGSLDPSKDKSQISESVSKNANTIRTNQIEGDPNIWLEPVDLGDKETKSILKKSSNHGRSNTEDKTTSQHLKAELERENDGSLMVKISVFNKENVETKEVKDTPNDNIVVKSNKKVKICREESMLMGKELHEKLKRLNYSQMARIEINTSSGKIDEWNEKTNKKLINKEGGIKQIENNVERKRDKNAALELKGTVCKRKKPKLKSVMKENDGADLFLSVDSSDLYPRHRTAYQEIEYGGKHKALKSKPTIKYTKSKSDEKGPDQNDTQSVHGAVPPEVKKGKLHQIHQTVLVRSSTVHLSTEMDVGHSNEIDAISGRGFHQTYPLNDWKKTVDEGKCGFIVKSLPVDSIGVSKKNNGSSEHEAISKSQAKLPPRGKKEFPSTFLTTSNDDALFKGENDLLLDDNNNETHKNQNDHVSYSKDNVYDSSQSYADEESKSSKTGKKTLNKSRPLYRSKPELPSIEVSVDVNDEGRKEDLRSTSIKTYHFPPIKPPPQTVTDTQKTLDDLFVSGVNRERSRLRDPSFISRKRPVSLDRGLIDDLVRYHTETSSIGFKNQQNRLQTHLLQSMHTHHLSPHHHQHLPNNSFLANHHQQQHQQQQPFKPQPEESPSLMPSVQKINNAQSNLRPRPASPKSEQKMTSSSSSSSKELDYKRQIQIYAHARKTHTTTNTHTPTGTNSEKTPMSSKQQNPLPDLQHLLGFNKLT